MRVFRSALTACVVKDLPDVAYYMPLDRDRLPDDTRGAGSDTNGSQDTAAGEDGEFDDPTFTVSVFGHDGDDDYDDYDEDDEDDENDEDDYIDED